MAELGVICEENDFSRDGEDGAVRLCFGKPGIGQASPGVDGADAHENAIGAQIGECALGGVADQRHFAATELTAESDQFDVRSVCQSIDDEE